MKIVDPGHVFELDHLDGSEVTRLVFVKREGDGYPGNVGHHEGTNLQEVMRALIARMVYLNGQIDDECNLQCIRQLRHCIRLLEARAARRHYRKIPEFQVDIENMPVCDRCRHIGCEGACQR